MEKEISNTASVDALTPIEGNNKQLYRHYILRCKNVITNCDLGQ